MRGAPSGEVAVGHADHWSEARKAAVSEAERYCTSLKKDAVFSDSEVNDGGKQVTLRFHCEGGTS